MVNVLRPRGAISIQWDNEAVLSRDPHGTLHGELHEALHGALHEALHWALHVELHEASMYCARKCRQARSR